MSLRERLSSPSALVATLLASWALVVAAFAAFPPYPDSPRLVQALLAVVLAGCAVLVGKTRVGWGSMRVDAALGVLAVGANINAAVVPMPQGQVLTGLPIVLGAMFAGYFLPPVRLRLQVGIAIGGYLLATRINPLIPSLLYPLSVSIAAVAAASMVSSLASRQQAQILTLGDAVDRVRTLSGLLPICTSCKRIRNDRGYWDRIEQYVMERTNTLFSHGLCPDCVERYERESGMAMEALQTEQVRSTPSDSRPASAEPLRQPSHKAVEVAPGGAASHREAIPRIPGVTPQVMLALLLGLLGVMAAGFAAFPPYLDTPRLLNAAAAGVLCALAVALVIARHSEPVALAGVAVAACTTLSASLAARSPTPQGQMLDAFPVVLAGIFASYFLSRRHTVLQIAWGLAAFSAALAVNPLMPSPLYLASVALSAVAATAIVGTLAAQQRHRIQDLQQALDHVRTLSGLLPICMYCKKVRNDTGYWDRIEEYLGERTYASFSQGLCPDCATVAS